MPLLLVLALLTGQPGAAPDLPAGPDLAAQRAIVPLLPPTLEFWIEEEAARQARTPAAPAALRARAAAALGPRATGPHGEALVAAVLTEVYARAANVSEASEEARRALRTYAAEASPQPPQQ